MNVPTGRSVISNGVLYETSVSYPSLVADLFFKSFILCSQVVKYAFRSYRMVHNYGGLEAILRLVLRSNGQFKLCRTINCSEMFIISFDESGQVD